MEYKAIQEDDLSSCVEIFISVFNSPTWNEGWTVTTALRRLTEIVNTPDFVGIKVSSDERMLGFVMGYVESSDDGSDYYLKEMCIVPGKQRQGIGTALLEEMKKTLVSMGVRKLYLLTSRDGPVVQFYQRNGFFTSNKMIVMSRWLRPIK